MRRFGLRFAIALLTFTCGVFVSAFVRHVSVNGVRGPGYSCQLETSGQPRFIAEGSLLEPDYQIYRFRTPASDDPEQIILFSDFRSAEVTRELFHSNATTSAATLIERGPKLNGNGHKIGERGITRFYEGEAVRIFWTDGDVFWFVQAPSLELAREFEQSEIARSITKPYNH